MVMTAVLQECTHGMYYLTARIGYIGYIWATWDKYIGFMCIIGYFGYNNIDLLSIYVWPLYYTSKISYHKVENICEV